MLPLWAIISTFLDISTYTALRGCYFSNIPSVQESCQTGWPDAFQRQWKAQHWFHRAEAQTQRFHTWKWASPLLPATAWATASTSWLTLCNTFQENRFTFPFGFNVQLADVEVNAGYLCSVFQVWFLLTERNELWPHHPFCFFRWVLTSPNSCLQHVWPRISWETFLIPSEVKVSKMLLKKCPYLEYSYLG